MSKLNVFQTSQPRPTLSNLTPASLSSLFFVQPNLGGESCEHEAILAFYSNTSHTLQEQCAIAGITQAFTGFTM
jgi:hypothetical protein